MADVPDEREPVLLRHLSIDQDCVVRALRLPGVAQRAECPCSGIDRVRVHPPIGEHVRQDATARRVVVDNEHPQPLQNAG